MHIRPQPGLLKKAIVVLLSLFFIACTERKAPSFKISGETMGTAYHITVLERDGEATDQQALQQAIDEQLRLINRQMSTYMPDSELVTLSQAPVGQAVTVSDNLFDVLLLSMEVSWLSNGAFDITVGPLVDLWGFGPGGDKSADHVPPQQAIDRLLENTGFEYLELDLASASLTKRRDVHLDLSGVAKGFGVDKIAELLEYAGYRNYMVEIGGELRLKGVSPRGQPWRIAIEEPNPAELHSVHNALVLSDVGMATSGDYRNYFEKEGRRYSHTIDPKTGYPIRHKLASVTVIAETCAYADALATALNVLGPERGMQLAQQQNLAVYMIVKGEHGFDSLYSDAFKPYLESR